jgi:hypothetical protein
MPVPHDTKTSRALKPGSRGIGAQPTALEWIVTSEALTFGLVVVAADRRRSRPPEQVALHVTS